MTKLIRNMKIYYFSSISFYERLCKIKCRLNVQQGLQLGTKNKN
jgi:hypothetical protein